MIKMLSNKIKCNHFDISVRDNEIDLQSLIPSSILPSGDELAEMQEYEEEMQDGSGADAIPEPIFNTLIEEALTNGDTRDALLYTVAANFGIRMSDCRKFRLLQFIDTTGHFRHKLYRDEQKTTKNRVFFINRAIETALVLYLRAHPDKKLLDFPFCCESGKNGGWLKATYIDENGKKKVLRENGKYVYLLDENGNKIPEPLKYDAVEKRLKSRLKAIGAPVASGKVVKDGEFKLSTHSFRKAYGEKFSEVATQMKSDGKISLDADVQMLITLDYMHVNSQTTLRYVKRFEKTKEVVCSKINLGLSVLEHYL
jgi:integrase